MSDGTHNFFSLPQINNLALFAPFLRAFPSHSSVILSPEILFPKENDLNNELKNSPRDFSAMGKKSAGTKSPSSLARSARNATKHGLAGKSFILLHTEDPDVFAIHKKQYYLALRPTDVIECNYVDRMAEQSWLMQRLNAMEAEAMSLQIEEQRKVSNKPVFEALLEEQENGDSIDTSDLPPLYSEVGLAYLAGEHLTEKNSTFVGLQRYRVTIERNFERAHKSLLAVRQGKQSTPTASCMLPSFDNVGLFRPSPTLQKVLQQVKTQRRKAKSNPDREAA